MATPPHQGPLSERETGLPPGGAHTHTPAPKEPPAARLTPGQALFSIGPFRAPPAPSPVSVSEYCLPACLSAVRYRTPAGMRPTSHPGWAPAPASRQTQPRSEPSASRERAERPSPHTLWKVFAAGCPTDCGGPQCAPDHKPLRIGGRGVPASAPPPADPSASPNFSASALPRKSRRSKPDPCPSHGCPVPSLGEGRGDGCDQRHGADRRE